MLNKVLERLSRELAGLEGVVCSSFRKGAADTVLRHPECCFKHVIAITNHDYTYVRLWK